VTTRDQASQYPSSTVCAKILRLNNAPPPPVSHAPDTWCIADAEPIAQLAVSLFYDVIEMWKHDLVPIPYSIILFNF